MKRCHTRQRPRAAATSGRSCSAACAVFFSRQAMGQEEAAERRAAGLDTTAGQGGCGALRWVRSGNSAASSAHTRSAWTSSRERFHPPYRSGATEPRRRQRCISLITKLTLTSNLAAVARRNPPALYLRAQRARADPPNTVVSSIAGPSTPSDQFESQQTHAVNPQLIPSSGPRSSDPAAVDHEASSLTATLCSGVVPVLGSETSAAATC